MVCSLEHLGDVQGFRSSPALEKRTVRPWQDHESSGLLQDTGIRVPPDRGRLRLQDDPLIPPSLIAQRRKSSTTDQHCPGWNAGSARDPFWDRACEGRELHTELPVPWDRDSNCGDLGQGTFHRAGTTARSETSAPGQRSVAGHSQAFEGHVFDHAFPGPCGPDILDGAQQGNRRHLAPMVVLVAMVFSSFMRGQLCRSDGVVTHS